jgi:hypothetical protein
MEEEGSFEKSINKSYIFYVSLIRLGTHWTTEFQFPTWIEFLSSPVSLPDGPRGIQTPVHRQPKALLQE